MQSKDSTKDPIQKRRQQLLEEMKKEAETYLKDMPRDNAPWLLLCLWITITWSHTEKLLPGSSRILGPLVAKLLDMELLLRDNKENHKDGILSQSTEQGKNTPAIIPISFGKGPRTNKDPYS